MTIVQSPVQIITSTIVKPVVGGGGGDPGFIDPTSLSDLAVWYDFSDTGTISDTGGLVDQVDDKSGNDNHATATGTNRPTTGASTYGSLNVLDFDGNDELTIPSSVLSSGASARTVFLVASRIGNPTQAAKFLFSQGNGTSSRWTLTFESNSPHTFTIGIEGGAYQSSLSIAQNDWAVIGLTVGGSGTLADHTFIIDGATEAGSGGTTLTTQTGNNLIGGRENGNNSWQGSIGEVIYYTRALTTGELNQVGNYLSDKWAPTTSWTDIT